MTRLKMAAAALVLAASQSWAQDTPTSGTSGTAPAAPTVTLAMISKDGLVEIDWTAVEKVAAETSPPDLVGYARLMLAIRDGTWKPLVQEAGK